MANGRGEWFWFVDEMLSVIPPDEVPVRRKPRLPPAPPSVERLRRSMEVLGIDPATPQAMTLLVAEASRERMGVSA